MGTDPTKSIEEWFAKQKDDIDFVSGNSRSYCAFPPSEGAGVFVYATKSHPALLALGQCGKEAQLGVIAPSYGLPPDLSCAWLRDVVADHKLFFLGDMDPVDLMIFAWLSARLSPKPVMYLGISDNYLRDLQVIVPKSSVMSCSSSEQEAITLLSTVFPGYREAIGEECSQLLAQGQKIEIEAVVSALGSPDALLLPALGGNDA